MQPFKYILSGFGRTFQEMKEILNDSRSIDDCDFVVPVYRIPIFDLRIENDIGNIDIIQWKDLHVAISKKYGFGAELILPSTMFRRMRLVWDQSDINKPFVEIISVKNVQPTFAERYPWELYGCKLLKQIFCQDDLKSDTAIQSLNAFD